MSVPEPRGSRVSGLDLFIAFSVITVSSFGGMLFWTRRLFVERRRWISEQEFVEIVALAQLLPGVNGFNLAVILGYHFSGWSGAAGALSGFLAAPCLVVTGIAVLYQNYGALPLVQDALTGMGAVALGLLLATGAKMATVLQRRWLPWLFVMLAFLGVGVMRWPLIAVLIVLAPCAIVAAWKGRH